MDKVTVLYTAEDADILLMNRGEAISGVLDGDRRDGYEVAHRIAFESRKGGLAGMDTVASIVSNRVDSVHRNGYPYRDPLATDTVY